MTFKAGRQSRPRKYPQEFEKTIIDNILKSLEFQKATHACAFCFCLGVSRSFASDTSPKRIDREGLGKRRTGTRQDDNDENGVTMTMTTMLTMTMMIKEG